MDVCRVGDELCIGVFFLGLIWYFEFFILELWYCLDCCVFCDLWCGDYYVGVVLECLFDWGVYCVFVVGYFGVSVFWCSVGGLFG